MSKSKSIIISPSGNYYGSEQVLVDFLLQSSNHYTVYIPKNSRLASNIDALELKHTFKYYSTKSLRLFYLRIALLLLFKRADKVYVNEGGHIRYVKLLAIIFTSVKFFVHIRILEDTDIKRTGLTVPANITFITVSNFMMEHLEHIENKVMIYDPYNFTSYENKINTNPKEVLRIGIVGRIVENKGLKEIISFFKFLIDTDSAKNYLFNFFGEVFPNEQSIKLVTELKNLKNINIVFHGFVSNKQKIYENIDCLIHFYKYESLGRIFFEALQYEKPLIGFSSGGINELAKIHNLNDLLVDYDTENKWHSKLLLKLERIRVEYYEYQAFIKDQLKVSSDIFSVKKYSSRLDTIIG